eukprot:221496-Chlamydomonas_euryale.AAC.1
MHEMHDVVRCYVVDEYLVSCAGISERHAVACGSGRSLQLPRRPCNCRHALFVVLEVEPYALMLGCRRRRCCTSAMLKLVMSDAVRRRVWERIMWFGAWICDNGEAGCGPLFGRVAGIPCGCG